MYKKLRKCRLLETASTCTSWKANSNWVVVKRWTIIQVMCEIALQWAFGGWRGDLNSWIFRVLFWRVRSFRVKEFDALWEAFSLFSDLNPETHWYGWFGQCLATLMKSSHPSFSSQRDDGPLGLLFSQVGWPADKTPHERTVELLGTGGREHRAMLCIWPKLGW